MNRYLSYLALAVVLTGCNKKPEEPTQAHPVVSVPPAPEPSKAEAPPAATPSAAAAPAPAPSAVPIDPALLKPDAAKLKAPAKFKVTFTTTKGDFVVEVTRAWAPNGADRFYNLVKLGFFADIGFFRVVPNFVVQFGIHGSSEVAAAWKPANIQDDKQGKQSNEKGTVTFAKAGPNTRTTQLFINFKDNANLDAMGFPPIGKVIQGMEVVEAINKEYTEQPDQGMIQTQGNKYLRDTFPRLDYIKSATITK
jgi:peptidyl-prolyl cis-trans isomerase A (cyclophilin A)